VAQRHGGRAKAGRRWEHATPSPVSTFTLTVISGDGTGSNELLELDLVGPIYLKGCGHRYYIRIGKDTFGGAVCLCLVGSRRKEEVLWFLEECWEELGFPE